MNLKKITKNTGKVLLTTVGAVMLLSAAEYIDSGLDVDIHLLQTSFKEHLNNMPKDSIIPSAPTMF